MSEHTKADCPDQCPLQEGCPGQCVEHRVEDGTAVTYQLCEHAHALADLVMKNMEKRHELPLAQVKNPE